MNTPVTHAEQGAFEKEIDAELRRLSDEDQRQNRRIDALEESVKQNGQIATAVEKLAVNMESMYKEQERQGKRLGALENRNEIPALSATMERMTATLENALAVQKQQSERLENLEKRDGEKWRNLVGYIITAAAGLLVGFVFHQIGIA